MNKIARDEADILNVDAEDLYIAGRIFNLEPFAMEEDAGCKYLQAISCVKYRIT